MYFIKNNDIFAYYNVVINILTVMYHQYLEDKYLIFKRFKNCIKYHCTLFQIRKLFLINCIERLQIIFMTLNLTFLFKSFYEDFFKLIGRQQTVGKCSFFEVGLL